MKHSIQGLIILTAILFLFTGYPALGADKKGKKQPADKTGSQILSKTFNFNIMMEGILESKKMEEISIKAKEWSSFKVLKAARHGSSVKQGDLLLLLDTKGIDKAITATKKTLNLTELSLKAARLALQKAEESFRLDMAAAERKNRIAQEDLQRYLKIELPDAKEYARHSVKMTEESLEYEMEELRQLEKMYKADDLTEETEEIVLKRQRNRVENVKYSLKKARKNMEKTLKITLPRQLIAMKDGAKRAELNLKEAKEKLPVQLKTAQIEFEQKKMNLSSLKEKLANMAKDRKAMMVKAPCSGTLYYGKCTRGIWSDSTQIAPMLEAGGTVKPDMVLMTVVKMRPLLIRSVVEEAKIHRIKEGLKGTGFAVGYPNIKFNVITSEVDSIPLKPGFFGVILSAAIPNKAEVLVPGMRCKIILDSH